MKRDEFLTLAGKAWDLMEANPHFRGSIELAVWRYKHGNKQHGRTGWIYNLDKKKGTYNEDPKDFETDFNKVSRNHPRSWWRWDCE